MEQMVEMTRPCANVFFMYMTIKTAECAFLRLCIFLTSDLVVRHYNRFTEQRVYVYYHYTY